MNVALPPATSGTQGTAARPIPGHEDIVSGSGTFVTGGTFASAQDRTAGISGGVARHIEAGDFVVLPPGTPHWFSKIDGSITYVETRFTVKK